MARSPSAALLYAEEIEDAASRFADHVGLTAATVLRWIEQFDNADRPLAVKVLKTVRYMTSSNVRAQALELQRMITAEFKESSPRNIYYVPVGGVGTGAQIVCRQLRAMKAVPNGNVVSLTDLAKLQDRPPEVLVFVDDFSGTGKTIHDWWVNQAEQLVLPLQSVCVAGVLVLNLPAQAVLEKIFERLCPVELLHEGDNVLASASTKLTSAEKTRLAQICDKTKCGEEYRRGYGDCGLLFSFQHGCPNNSLPVLWWDKAGWKQLFQRRGI